MAKLTLTDISSGYASTSTINSNNAALEAALENTLSRDGTSPNQMLVNLDMNSNKVVNLAEPTVASDAATKSYVDANAGGGGGGGGLEASDDATITGDWTFNEPVSVPTGTALVPGGLIFDGASLSTTLDVDINGTYVFESYGNDVFTIQGAGTPNAEVNGNFFIEGNLVVGHDNSSDSVTIDHDGTDVNITLNSGTDVNLSGFSDKFRLGGPLDIEEQADHGTVAAGWGQLWVKSDTPNTLIFTDDAGTDHDLTAVAGGGIANVSEDATPQLGGDLETNSNDILIEDDDRLKLGNSLDVQIWYNSTGSQTEVAFSDPITFHATPDVTQLTFLELDDDVSGGGASANVKIGPSSGGSIVTGYNNDTGTTSAAQVKSHDGAYKDVGFNTLDVETEDTSDTLEAKHCGGVYFKDGTGPITLTLEASTSTDFPVGGVCTIINANGTGDITVSEGSGTTLYYLDGSTRTDTAGGGSVGPGGIATLWREAADIYYIWGSGITA